MSRYQFLILAAIVPGIFGSVMMVAPDAMLSNTLDPVRKTSTGHQGV